MNPVLKSPLNNKSLTQLFECTDYSVSQEVFSVLKDNENDLLITSPQPIGENLHKYYESENYISHTDRNKTFVDKIYQWVKKHTLLNKADFIDDLAPDKGYLLDIGCGTADFLVTCKGRGWITTGIEPNKKARDIGIDKLKRLSGYGNENIHADLDECMAREIRPFDVITLWHVLEHIPDLTDFVKKLQDILAESGTLVIAVPNYKSHDARFYGKFWAAFDVPRHLWHFSKKSMKVLFESVDMNITEIKPMKWDAFYVSLLSEKYKSGKNNYLKAVYTGWVSNWNGSKDGEYSSLIYVLKKRKSSF